MVDNDVIMLREAVTRLSDVVDDMREAIAVFDNLYGDDGQVTVPYERLQELLLYTADLEDYLDRYGYFDVQNELMNDGADYDGR